MNLKKIITISGQPDLFKMITNTHKGIIVESIITKIRQQVFASQRVNSLDDISVYTNEGDVKLVEVLAKMYTHFSGKQTPELKGNTVDLKEEFEKFLPDYDKDKVKVSAMKKIFKWYNILNENGLVDEKVEEEEPETDENNQTDEEEIKTQDENKEIKAQDETDK